MLIIGVAVGFVLQKPLNNPTEDKLVAAIPTPNPTPDLSYYEELIKKEEQFTAKGPFGADLTGDDSPEHVYITTSLFCASCHDQTVRIFDGTNEIFNEESDDVVFSPFYNTGFVLRVPVRKDGEPYCCPTEFSASVYEWSDNSFVKLKSD